MDVGRQLIAVEWLRALRVCLESKKRKGIREYVTHIRNYGILVHLRENRRASSRVGCIVGTCTERTVGDIWAVSRVGS